MMVNRHKIGYGADTVMRLSMEGCLIFNLATGVRFSYGLHLLFPSIGSEIGGQPTFPSCLPYGQTPAKNRKQPHQLPDTEPDTGKGGGRAASGGLLICVFTPHIARL